MSLIIELLSSDVPTVRPSFTARELELLHLMVQGYSNPEIALKLYISPSTVKTHVRNIQTKLGTDNRVQTVVYTLRSGIV